ncbi:hypothetical protein DEO72_LG5g2381 [Vigna unguiculata]|uniref:Uncharacterized protein n=1 Tax=Vigna unguiculata TaxID=3917 RepID=A0A4D6M140_VIGUN|nr:hypothetical protein DEO72_LG5g2381 [Vigna unguiculata]
MPRRRLAHQPVLPGETGSDRLAVHVSPPGASALPAPLDSTHRLAEHFLAARRPTLQGPLYWFLSPGAHSRAARRYTSDHTLDDILT